MVGKTLGNRYEIMEELGGGGMAIVYKGRDKYLNRLVTIKILRPEFTSDKDFISRFQHEAQAVARLSHPNIVGIYDVGHEDSTHYLIMEYVHGDNLKNIIKRDGPLSPERAARIAIQICEALQHAHESNIVHRDVKPHNILITHNGWAKLTDFGIAREITAATFTCADTIMGSVHYIAPEQARGQVVTPKTDLYSLGIVLYEMLTGTVPYQGNSPVAIAIKHIQEQAELPSKLNPKIPLPLERIVLKAISKDPALRFKSAREMIYNLQTVAAGDNGAIRPSPDDDMATRVLEPVEELVEKNREEVSRKRRLRPFAWFLLGLSVILLLLSGIYAFDKYYLNVPEVKVPDVTGKPLSEAKNTLSQLGLKVGVAKVHHPKIEEGYVIAQDIGPDDPEVKPPRQVTLTVSLGPDMREAPDLYQLDVTQAKLKLAEAGLEMAEQITEDFNDTVAPGLIFKQEPPPKTKLPKGSPVSVYVSKGPPPVEVLVPDLTGSTIDQADAILKEKNLKLDENIEWGDSGSYLSGQIISQEPAPGNLLEEGSAVKVTVSKGPGPLPRKAEVTVSVPKDGQNHQVRINVSDIRGSKDIYIKTHAPGDELKETVEFYGKTVIKVYLDNNLVKSKTYN